jgi:hypothetical protein
VFKTPVTTVVGGQVQAIRLDHFGNSSVNEGSTDAECVQATGPGGECIAADYEAGSNFGQIILVPSLSRTGTWSCSGCVSIPIPSGQVWTESTDAPSFPDQAAQQTRGSGPLKALVGTTNAGTADFRDAYCVRINDYLSFSATTDPRIDPKASGDFDTSLMLFHTDGRPVLGNADLPPRQAPFLSALNLRASDGSGFSLQNRIEYVLVVAGQADFPEDRDNVGLFDFQPPDTSLRAQNPAAGHFDHWTGGGDSGSYTVILDGAEYCQTDLDAAFSNPGQAGKVCVGDDGGRFSCSDTAVGNGQIQDVAVGFLNFNTADLVFAASSGNQNKICRAGAGFCNNISEDTENSMAVAIGLVDGDQYPDVVFANDGQTNRVCLNGGGLSDGFPYACSAVNSDTLASKGVALGYINKDKHLDAIFTNTGAQDSVCLGDGTGAFTCDNTQFPPPIPVDSESVALGHVNADAHLDAVFTSQGNGMVVCLGDGNGGFSCTRIFGDTFTATDVALGDVDQNGTLDAVLSRANQNPNVICLGDGAGAFSCNRINDETITSRDVALGLIDEDHHLDAMFANENLPNQLCLGNGSGGFTCSNIDNDFGNTQSVALGELIINLLFGNGFEN